MNEETEYCPVSGEPMDEAYWDAYYDSMDEHYRSWKADRRKSLPQVERIIENNS